MATLEALPLVIVFVVLMAYMFGAFGVVHTAILNSIAARNYAFEIFRHRANLVYLRDSTPAAAPMFFLPSVGNRVHAIDNEDNDGSWGDLFFATERRLAMGIQTGDEARTSETMHNETVFSVTPGAQNSSIGVNPVWIMSQYGICLNARCGGGPE